MTKGLHLLLNLGGTWNFEKCLKGTPTKTVWEPLLQYRGIFKGKDSLKALVGQRTGPTTDTTARQLAG